MRYATVFSGIEAPTVAWECLGWEPQWFAEIEPFPSGVLAHHYPDVPNLGDMTKLKDTLTDEQKNVQVLCGGSPCQSFSIAGLREGLADPRGNLTLEYVRLVDAVRPEWVIWENVPGVLSANGGEDFQAFLDAMGHVGYFGAYRVLDAQYFGVPQRRRRVFAIFCPGDGTRAVEVLFERQSVCGYTPPSREAGQGTTRRPKASLAVRTANTGANGIGVAEEVTHTLDGAGGQAVAIRMRAGKPGGGNAPLIRGVPMAFTQNDAARDASVGVAPTLRSGNSGGTVAQCVAFEPGILKRDGGDSRVSEVCPTLRSNMGDNQPAVAIRMRAGKPGGGKGALVSEELSLTLAGSNDQTIIQAPALTASNDPSRSPQSAEVTRQVEAVHAASSVVRRLTPTECMRLQGFPDGYTQIPWRGKPAEDCPDGPQYKALGNSMAVPVMRWIGTRMHLLEAGLGVYL